MKVLGTSVPIFISDFEAAIEQEAVAKGATLRTGGTFEGQIYQPTILNDLDDHHGAERLFVRDSGIEWDVCCNMGIDKLAVVDPELRVHGLHRLRVADASVMPRVITGPTNAPTQMIAGKAAQLILAAR